MTFLVYSFGAWVARGAASGDGPRSLTLNDPWQAPTRHWQEDRDRLLLTKGAVRRVEDR